MSERTTGPEQPVADTDRSGRQWRLRPRGMDPEEIRHRFTEVQGEFVDDPQRAVSEAEMLAGEVADAVVAEIEARRSALRSAWDDGADTSTETLRMALRDYHSFVEYLTRDGA